MKSSSNMTSQQKSDLSQDNATTMKPDAKEQSSHSTTNLASFFVRAGKKSIIATNEFTMSMKKKKKTDHSITKSDFITNFAEIVKSNPPPVPPTLLKTPLNRPLGHNAGKIKVIVRLKYLECAKQDSSQSGPPSQSFITVDTSKKQITVIEPPSVTSTPRRMLMNAPKIFAFDAVYTDDDDLTELCSNALTDIIQAVVNGIDGCIFSFGHLRGASSFTMIGSDQQNRKLGLIPSAISWLFRLITEQKEKTGARFSVRVSAIEVCGKNEILKDLLSDVDVLDTIGQCSPGVYLRDDPVSGTQLQNQSELRAPTAEKAAYYLDVALAARTIVTNEDDARMSHFLFTLHVYQYRVERGTSGSAVAGGRSRLHMVDFASGRTLIHYNESNKKESLSTETNRLKPETQFTSTALSLSATGAVLLALVNGQRHIPYRTSKLSQLLRETMSSLACRTCMIAQVAVNNSLFADNMQIIQFASKMQRLKRRKLSKMTETSSDDSSSCDSFGLRRASRFRTGNINISSESSNNGMTSSEADYTSSSDQSCDTVIYLGASHNKGGEKQSSFMLRKRRISAPNFNKVLSKKSGSESDLTKIDISKHNIMNLKSSVRTNALAWPKVAAKNAIETLSTQKEMWVDGPKAINVTETSVKDEDISTKFVNTETQTYLLEESEILKENQLNPKDLLELTHDASHKKTTHKTENNFNSQEIPENNTPSKTSTTSTTNDNPSSFESTMAVVGSSESDQKINIIKNDDSIASSQPLPMCHKAQIPNTSLPISTHLDIERKDILASSSQSCRPFVWDWVEKHSDMLVCSPFTNDSGSNSFHLPLKENSQSPQNKVVKHCSKHQQLLAMKKIKQSLTNESTIPFNEREGRKRHKSAKQKPAQIPQTYDTNFHLNQNTPSVEPTFTRVAEWVRSVSEETSRTQSLSPVRRSNNVKDHNTPLKHSLISTVNVPSTSNLIYRSLDRNEQYNLSKTASIQYAKYSQESFDNCTSILQYSCVPSMSKTFDSNPLSILHSYQKELITTKFWQECVQTSQKVIEPENHISHHHLKKTNSQNEEITISSTSQHKVHSTGTKHNHSSTKQNKNSPTRQVIERNSPSKFRSSSLIKTALFGRCRLSSNNNVEEINPYSVPNSPYKTKLTSTSSTKNTESNSVANTGGYHYVVMTSSINTPVKNIVEESINVSKKRSSSNSPGKSSSSSTDKKTIATQISKKKEKEKEKEKCKEKNNKEGRTDNKVKIKKESKGRLSFLTSPLFGKRKEKDKFISPIPKLPKLKKGCIQSKNDPINHKSTSKVISPYCTVTQPKHSAHSSSGHGSDCSSLYGPHHKYGDLTGQIKCRECTNIDEENTCLTLIDNHDNNQHNILRRSQRRGGGHTSSGYESIMRDSEVSSQNDSTSESSLGVVPRPQTPEKQQSQSSSSSSKQSRSAPNRSEETSEDTQSPVSVRKMSPKSAQKFHIKSLLQRENEIKKIAKQIQFEKIYDLLAQQDILKTELMQAKERILVDPSSWSYDLHVVEQMDPEDMSFIEALEKETDILRRRVEACKSHILLITYFDCKYHHQFLSDTNNSYSHLPSQKKTVSVGTTIESTLNLDQMSTDTRKALKP